MIPSCECGRLPEPDDDGTTQGPPKKKQKVEAEKKTVVVLLHGLDHISTDGKSGLESVKNQLTADLADKKNVTVLAPARTNSISAPIATQVNELYTFLQQHHKDHDVILYGHSQGAVLAAYLWCKHGSKLKIKCLVLDRGPLAGLQLLENTFLHSFVGVLNDPNLPPLFKGYIDNLNQSGIQDLKPSSEVIKNIVAALPNIDIPALLITAEGKSLEKLYSELPTNIKSGIQLLGITSFTPYFGDPNDGLIALHSQDLNGCELGNTNIKKKHMSFSESKVFAHAPLLTEITSTTGHTSPYDEFLAKVKSCIAS